MRKPIASRVLFNFVLCVISLSLSSSALAQYGDDHIGTTSLNDYTANSFYWKNRIPHTGYWQQDVWYTIKAELNDETEIITGSENLLYTNNSPRHLI